MLDLAKDDRVVFDEYDGDGTPRIGLVELPIWESKSGNKLVTLRTYRETGWVYRAYRLDKLSNLRRAK